MHERIWMRFPNFRSHNLKSKTCGEPSRTIENPKWLGLSVIAFVLVVVAAVVRAQQPTKAPQIGYLGGVSLSANTARHEAFRQGLRELHYVEGKNIVIDWRSADGKLERLPALAAEMVRLKLDVMVTSGASATRAFKEATNAIPIVMTNDPDPVSDGIIASLARPGGNITGLSTLAPELMENDWRFCERSSLNSLVWPFSGLQPALPVDK
jgi:ABC-type uncharacterized transport system substrate-binding protein